MTRLVPIPASLSGLCNLRETMADFIGADFNESERFRVISFVDEAVTNAIEHGYDNDLNKKADTGMESALRSFIFYYLRRRAAIQSAEKLTYR